MIEIDTNCVNYSLADTEIKRRNPTMCAQDVMQIFKALRRTDVAVWLDAGCGDLDALVETQTREHDDFDVVISLEDAVDVRDALAPLGFVVIADELPTRFVVRDARNRHVNFHTVMFEDENGGERQLQDGTFWRYPLHGCLETGRITGQSVPCLTADVQALAHVGYVPDQKDVHDLQLLAWYFGIELAEQDRERR